jgi:hypothetical protein
LECKHQPLGQSSTEQQSHCCSQAPHIDKCCIDILNIADCVILKQLITYETLYKI